jgi:phage major head subunit gpT-like protein
MGVGTMVRGQFPKLMALGLHKIYNDATDTEQRMEEYSKIFNVETSTSAYEQDVKMGAYGPLLEKPENTPVTYTGMVQGGDKRYIHLTYALGVRTSKELWDDDKYGVIKQAPKALARSIRFTKEVVAWNTLNQGFSNNVTTTDGLSLFNSQHPLLGGAAATNLGPGVANTIYAAGTYPNRPSVDIDLSFTAIQFATNQFERMIDGQGMPITVRPRLLVIPPELKFIARELLGSSGKPGSSDNDINSLLGEDLSFMVCHYLTSAGAWFLLADKGTHRMKVYMRQAPKDTFDDDFDTDAIKQKVTMRMSAGASDWIGTFGSNGV